MHSWRYAKSTCVRMPWKTGCSRKPAFVWLVGCNLAMAGYCSDYLLEVVQVLFRSTCPSPSSRLWNETWLHSQRIYSFTTELHRFSWKDVTDVGKSFCAVTQAYGKQISNSGSENLAKSRVTSENVANVLANKTLSVSKTREKQGHWHCGVSYFILFCDYFSQWAHPNTKQAWSISVSELWTCRI